MSLPEFPHFKPLEISDKVAVEALTSSFPPYSDFNFTNFFAWDVLQARQVANLNDNLAVLLTDYRTNELSFSFIGINRVAETALTLITHAKQTGINPILTLVPEPTATAISASDGLIVTEDPDNHDYIFELTAIADINNQKLKTKCRLARNFTKLYPDVRFGVESLSTHSVHKEIMSMLRRWGSNKEKLNKIYEIDYEEMALTRVLATSLEHELILSTLRNQAGVMIAFGIDEVVSQNYVVSHFIKCDISYKGIYEHMNQKLAAHLYERNNLFWNWQQDLSLEGLKKLKHSYRPDHYLKKYTVAEPITL